MSKDEDQRFRNLLEACHQLGLNTTRQRREILKILAHSKTHPDTETVYKLARKRIPKLSLDTVYRTLRILEQHGAILRVGLHKPSARYDADLTGHHHFVCILCGGIHDCPSAISSLAQTPPELSSFGVVDSVYIEWRGYCTSCAAQFKKTTA